MVNFVCGYILGRFRCDQIFVEVNHVDATHARGKVLES